MARTTVIGGGIGGLAAALATAAAGGTAVVLERAPEFAELGAGIQIAPNGMRALELLGVADRVREIAVRLEELRFMNGVSGELVTRVPLTEEYRARFGRSYAVVHRAELHRILVEACADSDRIDLRGGCRVVGYEQDRTSATAVLDSGERVSGAALIGADGIRSAVRAQLLGDGDPLVAGITVYRAIVPMAEVPEEFRVNAATWWTGPGQHFVHYPIAGGKFMNLAPSRETGVRTAFGDVPVAREDVLDWFAPLSETARRLLRVAGEWRSWSLIDRAPVEQWCEGRVALLGDAAHPSLHYLAQGACQALEDAVELGGLLGDARTDVAGRLREYTARRQPRTARVQRTARASIGLWHAAGAAAQRRDEVLRSMSVTDLHDRLDWMHRAPEFAADSAT
ncbi:FAD-dependent monooxygenase [Nocardia takedensis]|uniref:FAD-dependent monooxygenase n=1 Tax=Nocardia takedensis TaxID=259390 RepID=UPI0002F687D9|nr:FAD-dependent monooxygenase [Nocardia takedensis]